MFEIPFLDDRPEHAEVEVGTTPKELIYTDNKLSFYRYKPVKKNLHPIPFLIIYALINRNYILDLVPGTSFVEHLINNGIDVYIIDWGEPTDEDRFLTLDYFIDWYIHKAVKKTLEISKADKLTLFGYCMGGHLATIYNALHDEFIQNLIVLASPIDPRNSQFINIWADKERLNLEKMVRAFGNVPARFMQRIFGLIRDKMEKNYYGDINERDAVIKWASDNINIAGQAFMKYVKDIFQEYKLAKNEMQINGKAVKLNNITSNLMVITGNDDWVAPYEATTALHKKVSSNIHETVTLDGGHLSFIVMKNSKQKWNKVVEWHKEMSDKPLPQSLTQEQLSEKTKKPAKKNVKSNAEVKTTQKKNSNSKTKSTAKTGNKQSSNKNNNSNAKKKKQNTKQEQGDNTSNSSAISKTQNEKSKVTQ